MKFTGSIISIAVAAAGVSAQGAPPGMAPPGGSPAGCLTTVPGRYEVQNVQSAPGSKRDLVPRVVDCSNPNALIVQINNGVMTDARGRIAEIVANRQFQFDGPPAQTGSIYDAGWSMCANNSLAIGPSTNFYQCLSGSFYNLYDQPVGAQCVLIHQQLLQCADSTGGASSSAPASVSTVSTSAAPVVTPTTSSMVVSNSTMMSTTSAPVVVPSSTASNSTATAPVSQASDGQPQATSPAPLHTGAAAQFVASGAVAAAGAVAAFFL